MPESVSTRITSRPYKPGDERAINELYHAVTGRERSVAEHRWQWLSAPAGPGDMWLIHAVDDQGEYLIGHHGVMPLRFTNGDQDLLFGKIENTMVLPEYRSKILYPRFEVRFKAQYQVRYHALFATMGPDAAIRVRKASGYEFPVEWRSYSLATSFMGHLACLNRLSRRLLAMRTVSGNRRWPDKRPAPAERNIGRLRDAGFLTSEEATDSPFFLDFWQHARQYHGIAPRRDLADLKWRFWDNPYKQHFTLIIDDGQTTPGYAIVSLSDDNPSIVRLEDYAVTKPTRDSYQALIEGLTRALRNSKVGLLTATLTTDPSLAVLNEIVTTRQSWCYSLAHRIRRQTPARMPRYITPNGHALGLGVGDWNLTGVVFEGRA